MRTRGAGRCGAVQCRCIGAGLCTQDGVPCLSKVGCRVSARWGAGSQQAEQEL